MTRQIIVVRDGMPFTEDKRGTHRSTTTELVAEIERLKKFIVDQSSHPGINSVIAVASDPSYSHEHVGNVFRSWLSLRKEEAP